MRIISLIALAREVAVYRGEQITKILSEGYDGIFGDIGQPDLWWVKSTAGIPINPRTGEEYVARAYG